MRYVFVFLFLFASLNAHAFSGQKTIYLEDKSHKKLAIATISFEKAQAGYDYKITYQEELFGDFFLSMRPFRCYETKDLYCRQPYPYELTKTITETDFRSLEHDLLFIARKANEYGIDPYNGRYYILQKTDHGLKGTVYGVDLNVIASPPEDNDMHPIKHDEIDEMEADSVQFPTLLIE
ncbi:conserved exported hypothetical protein [Candidatus Terasakiella magnetica]|uniref:Uncharacterized protein n=1 Tax=Candidatus Terasakiella magnetica TaxID=1867952 RepID=A0A1C3RL78_9PROT|nr:hypothetical protein [Candidatus Terasakiella magnetica]SCA57998.1 conserved exported hypothetical protein [Candidatus Terasakiella magnetica]